MLPTALYQALVCSSIFKPNKSIQHSSFAPHSQITVVEKKLHDVKKIASDCQYAEEEKCQ